MAPPHLARSGELLVVGVQELVEKDEALDPKLLGKLLVHLLHLLADELGHLGLQGEVQVGGVGQAPVLGPLAHGLGVYVDEGGQIGLPVPEDHGLLDVRGKLQLVFQELGAEDRAFLGAHHVGKAVNDHQVAVLREVPRVPGVQPPVPEGLLRGLGPFPVPGADRVGAEEDLPRLADPDLGPGDGQAHGVVAHVPVPVDEGDADDLRLAVDLLEVDPDGVEEAEDVGAQSGAPRVGPAEAEEAELVLKGLKRTWSANQ